MDLSGPAFRSGLEYFLLHFALEGNQIYRSAISQIAASPPESAEECPFRLDLEHLKLQHWLPDTASFPRLPDFKSWCEELYQCMLRSPFIFIPAAEAIIQDLCAVFAVDVTSNVAPQLQDDTAALPAPGTGESQGVVLFSSMIGGETTSDRIIQSYPNVSSFAKDQFKIVVQLEISPLRNTLSMRQLSADRIDELVTTAGVVVNARRPYLKVCTLVARCKDCQGPWVTSVPAWKQGCALPRTCESRGGGGAAGSTGSAGAPQKCSLDPYVILSSECTYRDIQTVKIQELPDDVPTGDMPRHVTINLSASLVGRVVPGARVRITGVFSSVERAGREGHEGSAVKAGYIHALGIDELAEKDKVFGGYAELNSKGFSTTEIEKFHRLAADPDIIQMISESIAPSICGSLDVKRSIACMLFGGSRKSMSDDSSVRGDIHILLLGDPSTAKSQILKYVSRVAPIAVYTSGKGSSAAGLTAALLRDASGEYALEGGAMVLASGGIVCIDEFDKMRDDDRVAIHEAMEQQTISISKAGINAILRTECAVLAAGNPTFGSYDETKDSAEQHNFETTILSRFDCIWLIRDEKQQDRDRMIAQHVFSLFSGDVNAAASSHLGEGPIPTGLLKRYIAYCRGKCQPRLSNEAAKRLENFYVEVRQNARQENKSRGSQMPISIRQLESLVRLSESFAKMTLSSAVGLVHVEEAVRLFKISTVATNQATAKSRTIMPEDIDAVNSAIEAILRRLPINGRTAKSTIVRDLKIRDFEPHIISKAITLLVVKGTLEERADGTVKRTGAQMF